MPTSFADLECSLGYPKAKRNDVTFVPYDDPLWGYQGFIIPVDVFNIAAREDTSTSSLTEGYYETLISLRKYHRAWKYFGPKGPKCKSVDFKSHDIIWI
jgi:hypothetical protein